MKESKKTKTNKPESQRKEYETSDMNIVTREIKKKPIQSTNPKQKNQKAPEANLGQIPNKTKVNSMNDIDGGGWGGERYQ